MTEDYSVVENRLQRLASPGIKPGLARLARLLLLVGHPERKFKAVQVVGTNGKGSVSAMLASVFKNAGYHTALYTSPHLACFGERLLSDGKMFSVCDWLVAIDKLKKAIKSDAMLQKEAPTYFELTTAAAFMLIAENNFDIAIVEAGLGGRLDATSVIKQVVLSLIVQIGMDHTEFLGNTLQEIAAEKFAIVRPSTPALFAGGDANLEKQFRDYCLKMKAKAMLLSDFGKVEDVKIDYSGTKFNFAGKEYFTSLCGAYQADNAALAISASEILKRSFDISDTDVKSGLANVKWQGRMEIVQKNPLLLYDGAHNSHAMKRLAENIRMLFKGEKVNIVMAMMHDKDIALSLELLKGLNLNFYCTEVPDMERCLSAEKLCDIVRFVGFEKETAIKYPLDAIKTALQNGNPTIVCGSLYLIGWIKAHKV